MSQAISQTNHLFPRLKLALISIWAKNWRKIPNFGLCLVQGPVDWPLKKLKGPIPVPARLPGPGAGSPATRARCRLSGYRGPVPDAGPGAGCRLPGRPFFGFFPPETF